MSDRPRRLDALLAERRPRPPDQLVSALQDRPFASSGRALRSRPFGKVITMSNEQRYFDILTRIAKNYQTAKQLLRDDQHGLEPAEALELTYENMQAEAKAAVKGRRRPKL